MEQILKTAEISTEVLKLIHATREYCYLITPYFKPWPLLDRELAVAKEKKRRITIVCRADQNQRNHDLINASYQKHRFELILVNNLHMKLYMNESRVILSSMNLYDSSQERNYELGYLFDSTYEAKEFYRDVVSEDVLALPPVKTCPGWFHEETDAERIRIQALMDGFGGKGFCVVCGQSCDLDCSRSPFFVRCITCYSDDRETQNYDLRTKYCHYCGQPHASTGTHPFHSECKTEIQEVLESRYYQE